MSETFPGMFEAQVARSEGKPAVIAGDVTLTYAELNRRANRLARVLVAAGTGLESRIALAMDRSVDLLVAMLATTKAGACYLVLDPSHPAERIARTLADVRPDRVLVRRADRVPPGQADVLVVDRPGALDGVSSANLTAADRGGVLRPEHAVYVLYTSGSTGQPKGVVVEHRNLVSYLRHCTAAYRGLRTSSLWHSPLTFDATVTSVHGTLVSGGTLHIGDIDVPVGAGVDGSAAERPAFLKVTSSHLPLLADVDDAAWPTDELMVGGELLKGAAVPVAVREEGLTIVHHYGPTELTVGCLDHHVPARSLPAGPVPVGSPMPNLRAYVLDARLAEVGEGRIGELYVSGPQVTRGYWRQPGLTGTRFVANPFAVGERMYRTGDLARWQDGVLCFEGRSDEQINLRGFRVEPAEVEAALLEVPHVLQAAVMMRDIAGQGDPKLVAYLVVDGEGIDVDGVREHLSGTLPPYMAPEVYSLLDSFPLSRHGKRDLRAFPVPDVPVPSSTAPGSGAERVICGLFAEVLGVAEVGVDDDFFRLGGQSLGGMRVLTRIRSEWGVRIPVAEFLKAPTARTLAGKVESMMPVDRGGEPR